MWLTLENGVIVDITGDQYSTRTGTLYYDLPVYAGPVSYTHLTYIYNMYPEVSEPFRKENDGKTVTYIGSLVPTKGFHLLANAWKAVLVEVLSLIHI